MVFSGGVWGTFFKQELGKGVRFLAQKFWGGVQF